MAQSFFDKRGVVIAFLSENNQDIYFLDGTPAACIVDNAVCDYEGRHLGWFHQGWLLNLKREYVAFLKNASNGPVRPIDLAEIPTSSVLKTKPKKPCPCPVSSSDDSISPKSWMDSEAKTFFMAI